MKYVTIYVGKENNTKKILGGNMNINYNVIDDNLIQIYGQANGFAWRVEFEGRKVWRYSISFFRGDKRIKITTSEREGTVTDVDRLKKNILKKVTEK